MIKTKSTSKFEPRVSAEKLKSREGSLGRLPKADEFSDKKLSLNGHFESRMRSLKSEFVSGSQKWKANQHPTLELKLGHETSDKSKRLL